VRGANTGELIRIDEMLAIAGEAAKEVISVRRRRGADRKEERRDDRRDDRRDENAQHREFDDGDGVRWNTFAVYPSRATDTRARLPGTFQEGWLSFDSGRETRRHSPIPEKWLDLPDDALRALCAEAQPAKRSVSKG
jgi:hypothetical protein